MRNGQQKRMRGRNRRGHNPLTRVYESNGPDVKIRGTAHHVAEKYMQLARDAQASGDPVAAEGYFQFAEHYFRLIAAAQAQFGQQHPHQQQQFQRPDGEDFDDGEGDQPMGGDPNAQPYAGGAPFQPMPRPQQQHQPYQQQQHQQHQPQQQHQQPPQQPQHQPQPQFQGNPQQRGGAADERDVGLPAFITGTGGSSNPGPGPGPGNGYGNEQGDRDGGRYGRRHRRRFRPRGPGDFGPHEGQGENPNAAPQPATPTAAPAGEPAPTEGGDAPPRNTPNE